MVQKLNEDDYNNVLNTFNYVFQKLIEDAKDCPEESEFFISDSTITEYIDKGGMDSLSSLQNEITKDVLKFINRNYNELPWSSLKLKILTKSILFMRNLMEPTTIERMMKTYNVQVSWGATRTNIDKFYEETNNLLWRSNKFHPHKIYFNAVFSFLKIIMLRLTWKHLLYLKHQQESNITFLLVKWIFILNNFSYTLHLKNDLVIDTVTQKLNNYKEHNTNTNEYIEMLIRSIKLFLKSLCEGLGCDATSNPILNGNESNPFNNDKFKSQPDHDINSFLTINYYSIAYGHDFINYISYIFYEDSRDTIFAFINYIEEMTKFNPFGGI
ncbi:uncharacterized protein LOC126905584 isoform X2 [Daktulosphaira vitifoliae]|uniref:uncharacterized protein LOC126905584 isoform X2 n=1 Tax=Daktulosphaira vitifoliae TaxID=58002 RepID=UPI0021AACDCC|nr:uncharacterized protein LOC126905584 isoform X2 [Daktulosphaira vitifoliae]